MRQEQNQGRKSDGGIVPLSSEQRKSYPHIIYELDSNSPNDQVLVLATHQAMIEAKFPIAVDIEDKGEVVKAIVRSSSEGRRDQTVQSALFLGLTEATRRRMEAPDDIRDMNQISDISEYAQQVRSTAAELLSGLTSKPELFEQFSRYYGGLRWGLDQEKFTRALFVHGTDFSPDLLDQNLKGGHVDTVAYHLDPDLPYDKHSKWYESTPEKIFKSFPQFDYRRLKDPEFVKTPEGQKLLDEYTRLCGEILADQEKRSYEGNISKDGRELPIPQIPLTRHPIIEALVVNELSVDRPKPKYDFGPSDLTETVLDSDSRPAHESLVTAITTRLPEGHRRVFDGPDEFEHKHRNIWSVLRAYKEAYVDYQRRELPRRDLVRIIDAFTGNGEIATSVRKDNIDYRARSKGWRSDGAEKDSTEAYETKEIVRDLIKIGVTAPDPEIVARAEDLIAQYAPENGNELTRLDVLDLSRSDLMLVLIDALKEVSIGTQPAVFERTGTRVFGDAAIGEQLREFAEKRIKAIQIRSTPEVNLAAAGLRKFGLSFGDKKSPEEIEARRHFNELVRPADQLIEGQREAKNQLLLRLLGQLAESGTLGQNADAAGLFTGLVKRVEFTDYHMRQLPNEYQALMDLANNTGITERQRNDILWQMQNQFEYIESEAVYLLVPVILDMYKIALGPVDAVRLPTKDTDHGLAAATSIVRKHGHGMFKSASQDQLQTLADYGKGIRAHAEQIAGGAMLDDGESETELDTTGLQDWQKETMQNLGDVMRELKTIEESYERYLRVEAVKVYPHVYYPWLLEQFVPFWQKMQWEVGEGNRPSRDISELYRVLADHVKNRLAIRRPEEYTKDFDAIEEGHVDSLLKECYERMVVPHDIKYNGTVWREGLSFVTSAISHMPKVLLEQIKNKYSGTPFAEYLDKEYKRWAKEEDIE